MPFAHVVHPGSKTDLREMPTKDDGNLTKDEALDQTGALGEDFVNFRTFSTSLLRQVV